MPENSEDNGLFVKELAAGQEDHSLELIALFRSSVRIRWKILLNQYPLAYANKGLS